MNVLITGITGMLGRNLLDAIGNLNPPWALLHPTEDELDLTNAPAVNQLFRNSSIDLVVHLAARVGGIAANISDPVGFIYDNMMINFNLIRAAAENNVKKMIYLGTSCMYPKDNNNLLKEEDILKGQLEPTNEGYAMSKIAGARLCEYYNRQYGMNYKVLIPCNLFGIYDNFNPDTSHLIPAIIVKIHNAVKRGSKTVEIWGTGNARREFLFAYDLAKFIITISSNIEKLPDYLNVGYGRDYSVYEYYEIVKDVAGFDGSFTFNESKPEGISHKLLDSSVARDFGWAPATEIKVGIQKTFEYYVKNLNETDG